MRHSRNKLEVMKHEISDKFLNLAEAAGCETVDASSSSASVLTPPVAKYEKQQVLPDTAKCLKTWPEF